MAVYSVRKIFTGYPRTSKLKTVVWKTILICFCLTILLNLHIPADVKGLQTKTQCLESKACLVQCYNDLLSRFLMQKIRHWPLPCLSPLYLKKARRVKQQKREKH